MTELPGTSSGQRGPRARTGPRRTAARGACGRRRRSTTARSAPPEGATSHKCATSGSGAIWRELGFSAGAAARVSARRAGLPVEREAVGCPVPVPPGGDEAEGQRRVRGDRPVVVGRGGGDPGAVL